MLSLHYTHFNIYISFCLPIIYLNTSISEGLCKLMLEYNLCLIMLIRLSFERSSFLNGSTAKTRSGQSSRPWAGTKRSCSEELIVNILNVWIFLCLEIWIFFGFTFSIKVNVRVIHFIC